MLVRHEGELIEVKDEDLAVFKERYLKGRKEPENLTDVLHAFSTQLATVIANAKNDEAPPISRIIVTNVKRSQTGLIQGCTLEVQR